MALLRTKHQIVYSLCLLDGLPQVVLQHALLGFGILICDSGERVSVAQTQKLAHGEGAVQAVPNSRSRVRRVSV